MHSQSAPGTICPSVMINSSSFFLVNFKCLRKMCGKIAHSCFGNTPLRYLLLFSCHIGQSVILSSIILLCSCHIRQSFYCIKIVDDSDSLPLSSFFLTFLMPSALKTIFAGCLLFPCLQHISGQFYPPFLFLFNNVTEILALQPHKVMHTARTLHYESVSAFEGVNVIADIHAYITTSTRV